MSFMNSSYEKWGKERNKVTQIKTWQIVTSAWKCQPPFFLAPRAFLFFVRINQGWNQTRHLVFVTQNRTHTQQRAPFIIYHSAQHSRKISENLCTVKWRHIGCLECNPGTLFSVAFQVKYNNGFSIIMTCPNCLMRCQWPKIWNRKHLSLTSFDGGSKYAVFSRMPHGLWPKLHESCKSKLFQFHRHIFSFDVLLYLLMYNLVYSRS